MKILKLYAKKSKYCGESSGLFKSMYARYYKSYLDASQKIMDIMIDCFQKREPFLNLNQRFLKLQLITS